MAVGVNIYPPVLDTYMPAFLKGGEIVSISEGRFVEGYKIYLSLSDYNIFDDVCHNVQVTLVRQDTNKTAFLTSAASSGILVTELYSETDENGDNKYYIVIDRSALISKDTNGNGVLLTNIFYKVQIRFTSTIDQEGNPIPQVSNPVDSNWYIKYLDCFSEWSTVCLIKGIETPKVKLTGLSVNSINNINKPSLDIIGSFSYLANSKFELETLKSYRLLLYDNNDNLIEDSKEILTNQNNSPNSIRYNFTTFLNSEDNEEISYNYYIKLFYTTINLYSNTNNPLIYQLKVTYDSEKSLFDIQTILDNENGIIQLQITREGNSFSYPVIVKRASNIDNFKTWETIHTFTNLGVVKHVFNDMTVESGILYKYYAYYDHNGYTAPSKITEPQMVVLDFILLTVKDKQLKIYLDSKINNINYTISESKTDTIGGTYPVIRKNGNLMYRTLPIEGIIHSYMDDAGMFETKETIFGENKIYYENYNIKNRVLNTQDYVYEKFFRDKVKEFLFKDQTILLRTPSEGNLIVKCINNSFTPNTQLNNLIYKFTTQAVEIDKCTLNKIKEYSLLKETGEDAEIIQKTITNGSVFCGVPQDFKDSIERGN